MEFTRTAVRLTASGAQALVAAAVDKAAAMQVPVCIAVVDEGCNLLAFLRMDGSRVLSVRSAERKAMTAASTGLPSGSLSPAVEIKLSIATDGEMVNLKGGLPVIVDGQTIGGIGVGSGTSDEDVEIAAAALAQFPGAQQFG